MLGWFKKQPDPSKPEVTEFLKQMPLILDSMAGCSTNTQWRSSMKRGCQ